MTGSKVQKPLEVSEWTINMVRVKKLLDLKQNLLLWQLFTVDKAMHLKDMTLDLGAFDLKTSQEVPFKALRVSS